MSQSPMNSIVERLKEVRQQIVDEMMYRLAALLPEHYRGVYSDLGHASETYLSDLAG